MQPIARFVNPDGRTAYNFIFTFTNSVYFLGGKYLIRYSSYFDEPGALAFYLTLALILNKSLMDNKKVEIVLKTAQENEENSCADLVYGLYVEII